MTLDARKLQQRLGVTLSLVFRKIAFTSSRSREFAFWCGDGLLNRVTQSQPLLDRTWRNPEGRARTCPIRVKDASYGYRAHVPFVFGELLQASRPPAVPRLVISIAVQAINRVARRALTHVRKEIDKRAIPALAHLNSPTAILREILKVRVFAAPLHPNPDAVSRASFAATLVAVLQASVGICHSNLNSRIPLKGPAE